MQPLCANTVARVNFAYRAIIAPMMNVAPAGNSAEVIGFPKVNFVPCTNLRTLYKSNFFTASEGNCYSEKEYCLEGKCTPKANVAPRTNVELRANVFFLCENIALRTNVQCCIPGVKSAQGDKCFPEEKLLLRGQILL